MHCIVIVLILSFVAYVKGLLRCFIFHYFIFICGVAALGDMFSLNSRKPTEGQI